MSVSLLRARTPHTALEGSSRRARKSWTRSVVGMVTQEAAAVAAAGVRAVGIASGGASPSLYRRLDLLTAAAAAGVAAVAVVGQDAGLALEARVHQVVLQWAT